jgi:hypothetical protein
MELRWRMVGGEKVLEQKLASVGNRTLWVPIPTVTDEEIKKEDPYIVGLSRRLSEFGWGDMMEHYNPSIYEFKVPDRELRMKLIKAACLSGGTLSDALNCLGMGVIKAYYRPEKRLFQIPDYRLSELLSAAENYKEPT